MRHLLALVLFGVFAAPAAQPAPHAPKAGCAAARAIRVSRLPRATTATVRWRTPRRLPPDFAGYRVYRSGAVVGQTRRLAMRVRVSIGKPYVVAVRVALHDGRTQACTARRYVANRYVDPSRPRGLRAQLGDGTVTLRWQAAHPGDAALAGYRIARDGLSVGQVATRAASLSLAAGRVYSFAVTAVDVHGHTGLPATITVRTGYAAPLAPIGLSAVATGDTMVHLTWQPPARGAARIVGFRILRDGLLVRTTSATTADVQVVAGRTTTFTVVAVDGRGQFSPPSGAVAVTTTYSAPTAPANLTANAVSDSEIDLSWSPSTAGGGGRIVGYRVFRNGGLVRQAAATSAAVAGLAPATTYTFTVVAVDGRGLLSAPSASVSATTAKPVPSTGTAEAFLLATTGQSFRDLQAHYRQIGTVYPTYFECAADGTVTGSDDPVVTRWAQARGIRVLPRFNCQDADTVNHVLTDTSARGALLASLVSLAQANGYDGINLDLESGPAGDRAALTWFVADLASALHGIGKQLTVEVSAKIKETTTGRSGFYDYGGIAAAADETFVMAWGLHWTTSVPGPLAPWSWVSQVASYVASLGMPQKFVFGVPLYGLDWPAAGGKGNPATALEYDDANAVASAAGTSGAFDPVNQEAAFSYTKNGVPHQVWYENAQAVSARISLARQHGFRVGLWRLGREDQGIWNDPQLN